MANRENVPKSKVSNRLKSVAPSGKGEVKNSTKEVMNTLEPETETETQIVARIGQQIGKWRILSLKYQNPSCKEPYFLLRCECGTIRAVKQSDVTSGQSASCGCAKKVTLKKGRSSVPNLGSSKS